MSTVFFYLSLVNERSGVIARIRQYSR